MELRSGDADFLVLERAKREPFHHLILLVLAGTD
jgi:hypothetical protein